jgi:gluconolactonase
LYIADNGAERRALLRLDLDPATGAVANPRVLKDFGDGRGIDGMTVTVDGLIVAAAGGGILGGVYVYRPDGTPVAFLATPETPTNVEFGGPERRTLYITAGTGLYRIETILTGHHLWPPRR